MQDWFDNFQEESLFPTLIDEDSYDGPFCKTCGDEDSDCYDCQQDEEETSSDYEDFASESFDERIDARLEDYDDCRRFENEHADFGVY